MPENGPTPTTRPARRKPARRAWLPGLGEMIRSSDGASLRADAAAGLAVTLLALPLALTFATKAGLPLWAGLASAAVAALVAPLVAGSPLLSAGPTNASAALLVGAFGAVGAATPEERLALMPALLIMTGGFVLLGAWLRLARFADFIPRTVIVAIIAAAALRVLMLQLPLALGIPSDPAGTPWEQAVSLVSGLRGLVNPDLAVALATLIAYAVARSRLETGPAILAAVAVGTFFGIVAENVALAAGATPRGGMFRYVGEAAVAPGHLAPALGFRDFSRLFSPALALAVLVIIEGTANARASALKLGRPVDLRRELLGLGAANLACAAASGMPASGSVSRSALNISAGARTGLASVFAGVALAGVALAGSGIMAKIPLATLAVIVIAIERELVNLPVIRLILRSGNEDRLVFLATFGAALLAPLDIAIYLGTGIAVFHYLHKTSQPKVVEYVFTERGEVERREPGLPARGISILHVAGSLHFGATHAFHDHLRRVTGEPGVRALILKFREAEHLDADGALLLRDLAETLRRDGRHLILCELDADAERAVRGAGLAELLGEEALIPDDVANPTLPLAKAVRLAHRLLGGEADVLRIVATEVPRPGSPASHHLDWEI